MFNLLKFYGNRETTSFIQTMNDFRIPVLIWSSLVYGSTTIQSIREFHLAEYLIFSALFIIFLYVNWESALFAKRYTWSFFILQGSLISISSILMPSAAVTILVGLLPVLVGQSIGFYYNKRKTILVIALSITIFINVLVCVGEFHNLTLVLAPFLLLIIVVSAYTGLFFQQVHSRLRTQKYLHELEAAYMKVEELTLANERQRMARDLHDTMAQGVAGLIMQLEAIGSFITNGNIHRAQEISLRSTDQARSILKDARKAIDNLRLKPEFNEKSFSEEVRDEIDRFISSTGIKVSVNLKVDHKLSKNLTENILLIISECMINILKHANATNVWVSAEVSNDFLVIEVKDDGEGFIMEKIVEQKGHYGLLGIQERAKLLRGSVEITSNNSGTLVRVKVPIFEGENE